MVDLEKAYKIANGFFLDNDYVGVHEIRENADSCSAMQVCLLWGC